MDAAPPPDEQAWVWSEAGAGGQGLGVSLPGAVSAQRSEPSRTDLNIGGALMEFCVEVQSCVG
jgi:hypothetical protein